MKVASRRDLAMVSLILAALLGRPVENSRGWVVCPPRVPGLGVDLATPSR